MPEFKAASVTAIDNGNLVEQAVQGAPVRAVAETINVPVLALNDTVRMARLPADAVINDLFLGTADLGTTGTLSVGVAYPSNVNSGATIQANTFATSLDVNTAAVPMTSRRFTNPGLNTQKQKLWQLCGLTAKPACSELDIILTATQATTAAGDVTMRVNYTHI